MDQAYIHARRAVVTVLNNAVRCSTITTFQLDVFLVKAIHCSGRERDVLPLFLFSITCVRLIVSDAISELIKRCTYTHAPTATNKFNNSTIELECAVF